MQVIIVDGAEGVGAFAADRIGAGIDEGSIRVIGVATGSSPLSTYRALQRRRSPAFGALTAFALDEYVGLPVGHPESYRAVIEREVTLPLGLDPSRVHVPDGAAADLPAACADFERAIRDAGGIDLQLLGIGGDGHIGFNEPSSSLSSRTRVKTLTRRTREDNARFFPSIDDVPVHCVTQGLGTILDAREVLLVATGAQKAEAIAQAVEGPLSASCPASVLQLHERATIVVDEAAAARLAHREYYADVLRLLPTVAG